MSSCCRASVQDARCGMCEGDSQEGHVGTPSGHPAVVLWQSVSLSAINGTPIGCLALRVSAEKRAVLLRVLKTTYICMCSSVAAPLHSEGVGSLSSGTYASPHLCFSRFLGPSQKSVGNARLLPKLRGSNATHPIIAHRWVLLLSIPVAFQVPGGVSGAQARGGGFSSKN